MRILSYDQCINMLHDMDVPHNVIRHSIVVEKIASFLTNQLLIGGVILEGDLIKSAALLHDITKVSSMNSNEEHDITGAALLDELGYSEIAYIVSQHISLSHFDLLGRISEAEIVFYSDKRVEHEKIVSIDERYKHSIETYGKSNFNLSYFEKRHRKTKDLENKIFQNISLDPLDLANII